MAPTHKNQPPAQVIAEIGCNHRGDLKTALEMISVAANFCGVDAVKFQKRNNRELLSPEEFARPHPVPDYAYGQTYGEHREFLEFDLAQHLELMSCCEAHGVQYATSVWDVSSARELVEHAKWLKVPSACNLNKPLLEVLCREFSGKIHISTGMTTREELDRIVEFVVSTGRGKDVVLYNCTSGYPVDFADVCLLDIPRMIDRYGHDVEAIGFSGHHLGIAVDVAAITLGAKYIERHFTLDRTWKGTDHAASLEPDGVRKLVRDIKNVGKALAVKENNILDVEWIQRRKLKEGQIRWSES